MEKAVLIGAITPKIKEYEIDEYLKELEFLTFTAGGDVIKVFKQKIDSINSKTFLGYLFHPKKSMLCLSGAPILVPENESLTLKVLLRHSLIARLWRVKGFMKKLWLQPE